MKIISSALVISILFSGCATRNAFSKLDISKEQEAAIENTKSGKIIFDKKVEGIYSAVYLNNVYENTDKTNNYFYISLYLKNKNNYLNITLNGEKSYRPPGISSRKQILASRIFKYAMDE
ncbi:MAG: hypothetical protein Q9M43_10430 [Sulfurimonas sp.]|nr:hypothetical protein [Sulfurimonas sp.]